MKLEANLGMCSTCGVIKSQRAAWRKENATVPVQDDCTAASFSDELEALKSAWQAVGSEAPVVPAADAGISSPVDVNGEAATVSSDTATKASDAKLAAEAANDTGLEVPNSAPRSTEDSAAHLRVSGLLSAAMAVPVLGALLI